MIYSSASVGGASAASTSTSTSTSASSIASPSKRRRRRKVPAFSVVHVFLLEDIYTNKETKRFWKKKRKKMSPRKKIPPNHPGRRRKKKVYIIIWEADVLPLHHKRVVENNTPSTFRRELFIYVYIDFLSSTLAGNRIRGSSCFFSLPLEEEEEEEENTKFIPI